MIVVGVDVHKRSLTAVAVDEVGRPVAEQTVGDGQVLLGWASTLKRAALTRLTFSTSGLDWTAGPLTARQTERYRWP
jgi:hypothetical protein